MMHIGLKVYKEFVMMLHGTLGKGICIAINVYCFKAVKGDFPKESDGDMEYIGFKR